MSRESKAQRVKRHEKRGQDKDVYAMHERMFRFCESCVPSMSKPRLLSCRCQRRVYIPININGAQFNLKRQFLEDIYRN